VVKLSTILDQIDSGTVLLPEFQRGYVWNRDQVRGLMLSLYRGYPVGGLLLWETEAMRATVRGKTSGAGVRMLLLDGQQRITSLYGVVRGRAPDFFEGNATAFTGLRFNVETETFEFYAPAKMRDDAHWIDVTSLFVDGLGPHITRFASDATVFGTYVERLNRLHQLLDRDFHQETITGADKTVDVVVDIFNRVNSGGTVLSKGDLALAKICAQWPDARKTMREHLRRWDEAGFRFSLDWLLRNATAVATGRSRFTALDDVPADEFATALDDSAMYVGNFLDALSGRLGLDHDRVLMARYAFPVVSLLLHRNGGRFVNAVQRDRVLFWYVHAALWGRFAGSTETMLAQDYQAVQDSDIDGLITVLERWRGGNLDIAARDFDGSTLGSRFYPLLYLLTRVRGARDLGSGLELKAEMLGHLTSLQVHHIFPKALLYRTGYDRVLVNAIANFCFLTQDTNLVVGSREPADYLAEAEGRHPGVLASQWIPTDPDLWRLDRYWDFLAARRELLASAAQSFLTELRAGSSAAEPTELRPVVVVSDDASGAADARTVQVRELVEDVVGRGYAKPELDSGISDPDTGRELAVAEAFWPQGLQPGLGRPVILELDHDTASLPRLEALGYQVFTSVDALREYIDRRDESGSDGSDGSEESGGSGSDVGPHHASRLGDQFESAMRDIVDGARQDADYNATYALEQGAGWPGLATARRLLRSAAMSDWFASLWERGRLDLTVEALVLQPRFASLFTDAELAMARHRLEPYGYPF